MRHELEKRKPMRLSRKQIAIIKEAALMHFGGSSKVYLFGSRVDDFKKGGDIDLFIDTDNSKDLLNKKIKFLAKLNMLLGEQKIDLVIAEDNTRGIEKEARDNGVLL
jgi:predicted nucleotidyltransferase